MNINIKSTNMDLTDSVRKYLDKKLRKFKKVINIKDPTLIIDVEVGRTSHHHKSGEVFRAEINLHSKDHDLRSESEKTDIYAAIDDAKDDMIRSLGDRKEKKRSLLRKGRQKIKSLLKGFYRHRGKRNGL